MQKIRDYTIQISVPTASLTTLLEASKGQNLCPHCTKAREGKIFISAEYQGVMLTCLHCGLLEMDRSQPTTY